MPPPPTPPLIDDLVEEVLLRFPADSPASLVRAGLVCKRWCHLVSDPGFQRRYLKFHHGRAPPPMLGFLVHSHHRNADEGGVFHTTTTTRFVPTHGGSSLPHANDDHHGLRPCDSRHGRVLLHPYPPGEHSSFPIIVWNPITGEQLKLPHPPGWWYLSNWTAAVLCAATPTAPAPCDHLDCHRGPFVVVLVGSRWDEMYTYIYSSETGAWSKSTVALHSIESVGDIASSTRSTLVGNTLYFVLQGYKFIVDYNLCTRGTSAIKPPRAGKNTSCGRNGPVQLTTMEDGRRLGLVRVEDYSQLCLWSREADEPAGWMLRKVIELHELLPCLDDRRPTWHVLVGSTESAGIIFLTLQYKLFTVDLRSGQATMVCTLQGSGFTRVVPYMNFCTPVFRASSTLDGPRSTPTDA